jgi:hypothetical protein
MDMQGGIRKDKVTGFKIGNYISLNSENGKVN